MCVTQEDCIKVMRRFVGSEKSTLNILKYELKPLSETPLGYLSDHFKLQVDFKNNLEYNRANFFVKTMPTKSDEHKEFVRQCGAFDKEAFIYRKVLGRQIREYFKQQLVPQCYLARGDSCIVLEDLAAKGYKVHSGSLTDDHWLAMIDSFAKLHAATIISEERLSVDKSHSYRFIDHYPRELSECTFVFEDGHPRKWWAKTTSEAVAQSMQWLKSYDRRVADELLRLMRGPIAEFTVPSMKYRNVIAHADAWKNNIMFRQNINDPSRLECVLIDFQLARYVPAAFDLLTAMHLNDEDYYVANNFHTIVSHYYSKFAEYLANAGIDAESILGWDAFVSSMEHYQLPALIESVMFATIIFVSPELGALMLRDKTTFEEFQYTNKVKYMREEFFKNESFRRKYTYQLEKMVAHIKKLLT